MNTFATRNNNKTSSLLSAVFLGLFVLLGVQGCSSSNSTPVVNANPNGYYTGSASVKEAADNTTPLEIDDIQVLVNDNRLMVMSKAEALLYDATITSITGNNFKANVTIYKDGKDPLSTTISGTITEEQQITGNIAGTGYGNGSFTVSYDASNSNTASITDIEMSWAAAVNESPSSLYFSVDDQGNILFIENNTSSVIIICNILSGSATPIASTNLFDIEISFANCADDPVDSSTSGVYMGLATAVLKPNPVQGQPDVLTFVMMYANPSFSVVSNATVFAN